MEIVFAIRNTRTIFILLFISYLISIIVADVKDYMKKRDSIFVKEAAMAVGGKINLTKEEHVLNTIIMTRKFAELDYGFKNPQHFNFSKHYFVYRDEIKKSKVYEIIKSMPKGGVLHLHSNLMMDAEYLVQLTYEEHLYACFENDAISWIFTRTAPTRPCLRTWQLVKDLRNAEGANVFDNRLKQYFTMYTLDEKFHNADINTIWSKFNLVHSSSKTLLYYRPVFEKFHYDGFKKFYDDGVIFIEMRAGIRPLYELNGTQHDKLYTVKCLKNVAQNFKQKHPDFIGIKLIPTMRRNASPKEISEALDLANSIKTNYPELFVGFDLVAQEDKGFPLIDHVPLLLEKKKNWSLDYYLHAGETNWFGSSSDDNIIDAVLLETKRIGHAFSLIKHPYLFSRIAKERIGLEVNVISNSVLGLVKDIRLHPVATYLALGLPVILSSDDPGVWGSDPLSHDYYVTFVGISSRNADLRMLKQLALNSIIYSALNQTEKKICHSVFNKKWDQFVKSFVRTRKKVL